MRHSTLAFSCLLFLGPAAALAGQQATVPEQLASAVLALPEDMRGAATVLGYRDGPGLVELRRGGNGMVCQADDPGDSRFRSVCYAESLRPLFRRRRELRTLGLDAEELTQRLEEEAKGGDISLPEAPAAVYVLDGPAGSYEPAMNTLSDEAQRLYILFTPYRTAESIGLPAERQGDAPWVMNSGRLFSHIMVIPGVSEGNQGEDR